MDVSENSGTPKSSILIRFSIIDHPFWGIPIFGNPHIAYWSNFVAKTFTVTSCWGLIGMCVSEAFQQEAPEGGTTNGWRSSGFSRLFGLI